MSGLIRWVSTMLAFFYGSFAVYAQTTPASLPTFEAATIKLNNAPPNPPTLIKLGCHGTDRISDPGNPGLAHDIPTGRCQARYIPLQMIAAFAYGIPVMQAPNVMSGAPDWMAWDRFDLDAVAGQAATDEQLRLMLRALLADRFKLSIHQQAKDIDVLTLVVSNAAKLKPSKQDSACASESEMDPCGRVAGGPPLGLHGQAVPLNALLPALTVWTRTAVEDGTGLTGLFDISTTGWSINNIEDPSAPGYDANLPALPTMLKEQLGLALKSGKKPMNVLVIDHVEKLPE